MNGKKWGNLKQKPLLLLKIFMKQLFVSFWMRKDFRLKYGRILEMIDSAVSDIFPSNIELDWFSKRPAFLSISVWERLQNMNSSVCFQAE